MKEPRILYVDAREQAVEDVTDTPLPNILIQHFDRFFEAHGENLPAPGLYDRAVALLEKPLIERTLKATSGNQIKAAEILGINRNTLRKKIVDLGIPSPSAHRKPPRPRHRIPKRAIDS